ncbi:hypothetical protein GGR50DRAFT_454346 [Xylaria sp. CBS 124048]|nr:hypothetical protein GGR50DRAFT_454346 [Xylaria sp. CBS 124048]
MMAPAPIHDPSDGVVYWDQISHRLEDLYKGDFIDDDGLRNAAGRVPAAQNITSDPNEYDPKSMIPQVLEYLRDNDEDRDPSWHAKFPLIQAFLVEAHRQMVTGGLGFSDPKLRAALIDARIMAKVHMNMSKNSKEKAPWTSDILRGQTVQERLLTYPMAFPPPEPNRAKSQYRPVRPMPRPHLNLPLWTTSLKISYTSFLNERISELAEVDNYVKGENRFFKFIRNYTMDIEKDKPVWVLSGFDLDNKTYEHYMGGGVKKTCADAPPLHWPRGVTGPDNPDGTKGKPFYIRRGWQRAALQQCLNLFTSVENRAINTPWRRLVLPYDPPAPLPKDIVYEPTIVEPGKVIDEKAKDPHSWLHWSSQYSQTVEFLAGCQRRQYTNQAWGDVSAPALPINFRGPRVYRSLGVHDQHWLKLGKSLDNLEGLLQRTWEAAPRPFLRAILRDIEAGKQDDTGGPDIIDNQPLAAEETDDLLRRKRYWRRDIKRRLGIDSKDDSHNDETCTLMDELDAAWLRYLCEPSRTLEMCDPSRMPSHNLAIIFDAKLQSFFRDLETSGTPNSQILDIWGEDRHDIEAVMQSYEPPTLTTVVAYLNGCKESEVYRSGGTAVDPDHPNGAYQFALDEAEFLCVELHNLGRCRYIKGWRGEPARVARPTYNVHPEDRVVWRYDDIDQFRVMESEYLEEMVDHYDNDYGKWSQYDGNRLRFARELEFMMDHVGPRFSSELAFREVREEAYSANDWAYKRQELIRKHLVPEGLCHIGEFNVESIEFERESPYPGDLATWEEIGAYLTKYHEQNKQDAPEPEHNFLGDVYQAQTPERTVQYFRNLAYRMGRTMRYVGRIKERLQYLEIDTETRTPVQSLDLSETLKPLGPEGDRIANVAQRPIVVEKWWHSISPGDFDRAIEAWDTTIREGSGEVALLPPTIEEVLAKADPHSTFLNALKGDQDPFTVIREGIIDDCFQNRSTMYPGRLRGFKDREDKELQGYERPNLFDWATKDQRRYQAQHTRRHFFNMQRWPPCRILPRRLEAIRNRKDEVLRTDPSQPEQAYGILTYRRPVGKEKPRYADTLIDYGHCHSPASSEWRLFADDEPESPQVPQVLTKMAPPAEPASAHFAGADDEAESDDGAQTTSNHSDNDTDENIEVVNVDPKETRRRLAPYMRSDEKFAPGPAVFPMGDTLLKKHIISNELSNALYPEQPFYKHRLLGLPRVWQRLVGQKKPEISPMPRVARSNIPRSNPAKRKMPIEFLNGSAPGKKFRSDAFAPLQPGGNGGQFAAAVGVAKKPVKPVKRTLARTSGATTRTGNVAGDNANVSKGDEATTTAAGLDPALWTFPSGDTSNQGASAPSKQGASAPSNTVLGPDFWNSTNTGFNRGFWGPVAGESDVNPIIGGTAKHALVTPTLRVYPDPDQRQAKDLFMKAFPSGWYSSPVEVQFLYTSALIALPFSLKHQLPDSNVLTSYNELKALSETPECSAMKPFMDLRRDIFDMHCMNHILGIFGEQRGLKLQLGIVQENPNAREEVIVTGGVRPKSVAYLVGSKFNSDPDRIIVWVRISHVSAFTPNLANPYNNLTYNCYHGIGPKAVSFLK